jgi:N-acetylglutamate synthase-like GNAT family acetyltransferase
MATTVMDDVKTRITIRPAHESDLNGIAAVIEPYVDQGKLLERTYDELEDLLENFFVAVAVQDGEIVGCAALEIYNRKLAEIRSLAVAARVQGQGVGRMLVEACVQRAKEKNIFEVMAITASEEFFKQCGFDYTLPGLKKAVFMQTRDEF